MWRRFGAAVLIVAAFAVLFATVCPLAPTPTAVAKVKPGITAAPAIPVSVIPAVVATVPSFSADAQAEYSADVLMLTCVCTC